VSITSTDALHASTKLSNFKYYHNYQLSANKHGWMDGLQC